MPFRFDLVKSHHVMLFIIHSLGGTADVSRMYLMMYLADLKHLARYGKLILGEQYIAMKYGPAPFHIPALLQQLQEAQDEARPQQGIKLHLSFNEQKQIVATAPYSGRHLASAEVESIFNVIQQYKKLSFEELSKVACDKAWQNADINGAINIMDMATVSGAEADMVRYIRNTFNHDINTWG